MKDSIKFNWCEIHNLCRIMIFNPSYCAMNKNGEWFAHEMKPKVCINTGTWLSDGFRENVSDLVQGYSENWEESLERSSVLGTANEKEFKVDLEGIRQKYSELSLSFASMNKDKKWKAFEKTPRNLVTLEIWECGDCKGHDVSDFITPSKNVNWTDSLIELDWESNNNEEEN